MGQSLLEVSLHFVWATWDRLPLIEPEMERDLYRYISRVCLDDHCEVLAIGGMPDHVHLLVMSGSTVSISELMRHVKGGSSRFISETLRPGEWFRWQGSYGVFSVEPKNRESLIAYIGSQKQHHASGNLWPLTETTLASALMPAKAAIGPEATERGSSLPRSSDR